MKSGNTGILEAFIESSIHWMDESSLKISKCLEQIDETDVWRRPNKASNSIGNIMVHLCGNITQYILSALGEQEDKRERDLEFSISGGYTKGKLKDMLEKVILSAKEEISTASEKTLLKEYTVQGFNLTGIGIIMHVVEHYSYHTGQIAYWTKIMNNQDLGLYDGVDLNIKNE
jgi:uncharacterized damage-inducible protein DinB